MSIRTYGPGYWGAFTPDWLDGRVPVYTHDDLFAVIDWVERNASR